MKSFKTFYKNMKFHNNTMMRASFSRVLLKLIKPVKRLLSWPRNCKFNSEGMNWENEIL